MINYDYVWVTKHRTNNFGLGLTYCYCVMQQHGGSLDVESEIGIGTKVLLSFPAKKILKTKLTANTTFTDNIGNIHKLNNSDNSGVA